MNAATSRGLSAAWASARLARHGPNELPATARRGAWGLLRDVVLEPMFLLFVACGAIYLALGDRHEAPMLPGFVLVVTAITYVQTRRSEQSLEALRDLSSPRARVVRDGQSIRVAGRELVVGDIALLAEGDRVPADLAFAMAILPEELPVVLTGAAPGFGALAWFGATTWLLGRRAR